MSGKNLAMAYAVKRRAKKMAEGGDVEDRDKMSGKSGLIARDSEANQNQKGVHQVGWKGQSGGISESGSWQRDYGSKSEDHKYSHASRAAHAVKDIHRETLGELRSMPKPKLQGLAHGGFVEDEEASGYGEMPEDHDVMNESAEHEDDIVSRCMAKKMCAGGMYSKGGMVANGGEDDLDAMADGKPNNFDDLALRDDLDFHYDGANSGDELGGEDDDESGDVVARIMRKRGAR